MTKYRAHELAVDELTTELYHEHLAVLNVQVKQLRDRVKTWQERARVNEASTARLRARVIELAAMVDMLKDVNAAQKAEIVTLTAEVERMTVANNRRTQLVVDATLRKARR